MKKNFALLILAAILVLSLTAAFANDVVKNTVTYENDNYTFYLDNDLKNLSYSLKGYYVYMPTTLIGTSVTKHWEAAGPSGAIVVYRVDSNDFQYRLINYRTGLVDQKGYLLIPNYEVNGVKITPTKDGGKVTVYFETGGDKTFDLTFTDGTIHI